MINSRAHRLEQYTTKRPSEVLIVRVEINGEEDEIAIFKGYSSSLMRATAPDPEVPVLSEEAKIIAIDRVKGPLNPHAPQYIEQGLTWDTIQPRLDELGI